MSDNTSRETVLDPLPGPLQQLWVLAVIVFNLVLVGVALYFNSQQMYSEAGITAAIALFTIVYSAIVYVVIWWMKQV